VWATSWGVSTGSSALSLWRIRRQGARHPPNSPIEAVIIPIFKNQNKGAVLEYARAVYDELRTASGVTIDEDDNNSPGWKFSEWELAGVARAVEIGPRDMEGGNIPPRSQGYGRKKPLCPVRREPMPSVRSSPTYEVSLRPAPGL
jgi:prolyl-tRNA synthetase